MFLISLDSNFFSDVANFYVTGEVNRQNVTYRSITNPHWMSDSKIQGAAKIMVWCGIWGKRIVGPFFIQGNLNANDYLDMLKLNANDYLVMLKLNANDYLDMLKKDIFMPILDKNGDFPAFFQQDGAPPYYGIEVRRGAVGWTSSFLDIVLVNVVQCSGHPDITPMDFYL